MVITAKRKIIVSRMLAILQACEKIYHDTAFSSVPGNTDLVFSRRWFEKNEKINIEVNSRLPENVIISVEHGIGLELDRKTFLKMCAAQLKKIADAKEGEEIPALAFSKNAVFNTDDEINFSRRCEILSNGLETGKKRWSAGGVIIKTRDQDFPF